MIDWTRVLLLLSYTLVSVAGMVLLKGAETFVSFKSAVGFALYLGGCVLWIGVILRVMPLSQAFPMAAGALMLGTQLAGWLVLREKVEIPQIGGAILILIGVILVGLKTQVRS